tara:strand:+ start:1084 stop:1665 length:582 start_codon:yes stop_codon:yes gene_type:complete
MKHLTDKEQDQLKTDINHILDSGANDIRLIHMVENLLDRRQKEKDRATKLILDTIKSVDYEEILNKMDHDLASLGVSAYKTSKGKIEYVDPLSPEVLEMLTVETHPEFPRWDFKKEILMLQIDTEEKVIKQALKEYLGREITLEDAHRVQRIFKMNIHDKYILACDGVQLGMVRRSNEGVNFNVEFTGGETTF